MKKPSLIIRKKHIIMSCLTLMLGIAVYVNYVTAPNPSGTLPVSNSEAENTGNYGETELVNKDIKDASELTSSDYFAQARLDKMNNRDEAVQTLQSIMGGGDITEDEMVTKAIDAVEVSKLIESEGTIESLVKLQGFEDCVAYLDGESAKVVVKTEGLDKAQATAIKDIILGETQISAENIRIFEVK